MQNPTPTAHIWLDERGRAWIDDTNTKVIEVVMDKLGQGWSAEEIHFQHCHLSLAQIHAALSHYYDHKAEFDAEIERQTKEYEAVLAARDLNDPFYQKLRAARNLP